MQPTLSKLKNLPPVLLSSQWKPHFAELGLIIGCYFVYLLTHGLVFSNSDQAGWQNAFRVVAAETAIEVYWEAGCQAWAMTYASALVIALNWVYIVSYWPIVLGVGSGTIYREPPSVLLLPDGGVDKSGYRLVGLHTVPGGVAVPDNRRFCRHLLDYWSVLR